MRHVKRGETSKIKRCGERQSRISAFTVMHSLAVGRSHVEVHDEGLCSVSSVTRPPSLLACRTVSGVRVVVAHRRAENQALAAVESAHKSEKSRKKRANKVVGRKICLRLAE
jgi:hypothetical protein